MRNREIGKRRDATEIIRLVSLTNFLLSFFAALIFFIVYFSVQATSQILGLAFGLLVAGILALIAWGSEIAIAKFFHNLQGIAAVSNFILKIIVFFVLFLVIRSFAEIDSRFFVLGFVFALVFSLITSSVLVLREDGPDFDIS